MSLIIQNIQSQTYDKNSLISAQLAQEGIELVRGVRDSNWKKGIEFDDKLISSTALFNTKYQYYMDYLDDFPVVYDGDSTKLILRQDDSGFYHNYNYSSGLESNFSRIISITKLNPYTLQVDSTVNWKDHDRGHSYNIETMLYDWK
jgi:hypothetical protein